MCCWASPRHQKHHLLLPTSALSALLNKLGICYDPEKFAILPAFLLLLCFPRQLNLKLLLLRFLLHFVLFLCPYGTEHTQAPGPRSLPALGLLRALQSVPQSAADQRCRGSLGPGALCSCHESRQMEVAGFWEGLGRLHIGLQSYFCSRAFQRGVGDRQGGRGAVPLAHSAWKPRRVCRREGSWLLNS